MIIFSHLFFVGFFPGQPWANFTETSSSHLLIAFSSVLLTSVDIFTSVSMIVFFHFAKNVASGSVITRDYTTINIFSQT